MTSTHARKLIEELEREKRDLSEKLNDLVKTIDILRRRFITTGAEETTKRRVGRPRKSEQVDPLAVVESMTKKTKGRRGRKKKAETVKKLEIVKKPRGRRKKAVTENTSETES